MGITGDTMQVGGKCFVSKYWYGCPSETVALGNTGVFFVKCNGCCWWSSGIPLKLNNWILGRRKLLPPVDFVAKGPNEFCFVQFGDGSQKWNGPDSMSEALHNTPNMSVELLAFAPNDGWYIMWEDGSYAWNNIPIGLRNQITSRRKSLPPVEDLAISPNGEWFVRYTCGSWRTGNLPDEISDAVKSCKRVGAIMNVHFGQDPDIGGFLIRYS